MDNQLFIDNRKKIDETDDKIIKLIERRFEYAKKIGDYKKKNGIKIVDRKREKEVLESRIKNSKLSKKFTKKLFSMIIKESRRVQE